MNNFQLSGYLPFDLELKESRGGINYVNGCINVQRETKSGTVHDQFRFTAFGKVATTMATWLGKNRKVLIEGYCKENKYVNDTTGEKRSAVEFIVERWEFAGDVLAKPAEKETPPVDEADDSDDISDSEIPF